MDKLQGMESVYDVERFLVTVECGNFGWFGFTFTGVFLSKEKGKVLLSGNHIISSSLQNKRGASDEHRA
jgi:hypothetical protein